MPAPCTVVFAASDAVFTMELLALKAACNRRPEAAFSGPAACAHAIIVFIHVEHWQAGAPVTASLQT